MRPTDEEIQKKASEFTESFHHQFPQLTAEIAMRWTRDHDPWNYVENGYLPPYNTDVFVVSKNNADVLVAELRCGSEDYWEDSDTDRFSLSWVKCWMHIPQPKR